MRDLLDRRDVVRPSSGVCLRGASTKFFVLLSGLLLGGGLDAEEGMLRSSKTISADIVELIGGREVPEHQMHFWMNAQGLAMEVDGVPGKSPHLVHLFNYQEKKSWIVSSEGRRYCELAKREDNKRTAGGILSTRPCLGYDAVKSKTAEWNGLAVTVWQCRKAQEELATHYYSELYGIVVKEETRDGVVQELRNLQVADRVNLMTLAEGVTGEFVPLSSYRHVTINEFFFAKRPLEKYLENK